VRQPDEIVMPPFRYSVMAPWEVGAAGVLAVEQMRKSLPEMLALLLRRAVNESELRPGRLCLDAKQEMTEPADGHDRHEQEARLVD
jgi:hypothetical protein